MMYEEGIDTNWKQSIDSIGCGSQSINFETAIVRILKNNDYVINNIESVESNTNYIFTAASVFDKDSASGYVSKVSVIQNGVEYSSNYS